MRQALIRFSEGRRKALVWQSSDNDSWTDWVLLESYHRLDGTNLVEYRPECRHTRGGALRTVGVLATQHRGDCATGSSTSGGMWTLAVHVAPPLEIFARSLCAYDLSGLRADVACAERALERDAYGRLSSAELRTSAGAARTWARAHPSLFGAALPLPEEPSQLRSWVAWAHQVLAASETRSEALAGFRDGLALN